MKHFKFLNFLLLFALFLFGISTSSVARIVGPDSFGYTAIDSNELDGPTYNWIDIIGTGTYWDPDDDDYTEVPIGFTFNFYGVDYDTVFIGSNGYLTFDGGDYEYDNFVFPSIGLPRIAPFFDDLLKQEVDSGVYYETIGTAPNRMFVVTWYIEDHFDFFGEGYGSPNTVTFQVILYEGSNEIKFQYQDVTFGDSRWDYGASATVGINKGDGITAVQYSNNEAVLENEMAILIKREIVPVDNGKMYGNYTIGSWPNVAYVNSQIPCSDVSGAYTMFSMNFIKNFRYNTVIAYNKNSVICYNDPSVDPMKPNVDFDTTIATLEGTMNYYTPVIVEIEESDGGEPGAGRDYVHITVIDKNTNNVIYEIDGMVTSGSVYVTPLY